MLAIPVVSQLRLEFLEGMAGRCPRREAGLIDLLDDIRRIPYRQLSNSDSHGLVRQSQVPQREVFPLFS